MDRRRSILSKQLAVGRRPSRTVQLSTLEELLLPSASDKECSSGYSLTRLKDSSPTSSSLLSRLRVSVWSPTEMSVHAALTHGGVLTTRQYASGLVSGFTKILTTEGLGSLYAGFLPILAKQVPYAIGQFTVNERCTEAIYNSMSKETRDNLGPGQKFSVALGSGLVAGAAAAVLSHVRRLTD